MGFDIVNGTFPRIPLGLFLSGTGTEATGKTVAITISKNGGAYANPAAGATNATEIGNGDYYWTPTGADTTTDGPLIVRGTASGCDNTKSYHLVKTDAYQTGDSFARIGATGSGLTSLATQASVNTIDDFLDTEIAAILAAVDTEVGAIKTKTDSLTFTVAGQVDANIQSVNDVTVTGNGQAGTEWGP